MKKSKNKVSLNPNEKWQNDLLDYEENIEWRILSEKFAIAVMRLLRHENKTQLWLAKELDKSPQYISRLMKGKENLSLKSMANIQAMFNTEILSIKNIDSYIKHKDSQFYFMTPREEYIDRYKDFENFYPNITSGHVEYIKTFYVLRKTEYQSTESDYTLIEEPCHDK